MSIIDSLGLDMILLSSKKIGDITISATLEEVYHDELTITEHPVENGANINDHAFKRPNEVIIKCGWSNADYTAILGGTPAKVNNGMPATSTYVDAVYSQLLALQESRKPFDLVTCRRQYSNMLIQSLMVINDDKTSGALMVTATLREVIIVKTKATTLPPRDVQEDPAATAETENKGTKAPVPATPAPGGAQPIPISMTDGVTSGSL